MKTLNNIIKLIESFEPFNEQEKKDKYYILNELQYDNSILTRDNLHIHLTVSAWVVNQHFDKVLMVYHNLYKSYSWSGGHVDGDADLIHVAKKELEEETGIKEYHLLSKEIFALDILPVASHVKKDKLISEHKHMNITYLFQADDHQQLIINPDENSDVCWILVNEVLDKVEEVDMLPLYEKLMKKVEVYKQKEKKHI